MLRKLVCMPFIVVGTIILGIGMSIRFGFEISGNIFDGLSEVVIKEKGNK